MISFQSSVDRSDSSGKVRTLVNSTSQIRLLPLHQKRVRHEHLVLFGDAQRLERASAGS